MTTHRDVTNLIERLAALEDRLGISLEAVFAGFEGDDDDDDYQVTVNGELHPRTGASLEQDIELVLAVYDSKGRVIETTSDYFYAEEFFGFETFSLFANLHTYDISRIRLYPKPS